MDTHAAITERRSVKQFDPNHSLTDEETNKIFELAMLSPTAFNIQHWRIVNVTDKALRQSIKEVAWNQAQVTDASMLLILTADLKAWEKEPQRYWKEAPQGVQDFMVPAIHQYYDGKDQVQRDETMRSMGIVGQTIMLTVKAMGYDSCPMDGFDYDAVGKLISLPDDHIIGYMVAIGKATEPARPRAGQLPMDNIVVQNTF